MALIPHIKSKWYLGLSRIIIIYSDERREEGIYVFGQAVSLSWDDDDDVEDFEEFTNHSVQIQCVGPAAKGRTFTLARII